MKFKPFGKKYVFAKDALVDDFPDCIRPSIVKWLCEVLNEKIEYEPFGNTELVSDELLYSLNLNLREVFPKYWRAFLSFTFDDEERTCNVIAVCLQNYADKSEADQLENILSEGGSAYEVTVTEEQVPLEDGNYDLIMRVPAVVKEQAREALSENATLEEAWGHCYHRNPDYEKVVSRCSDFLEGFLKLKYFSNDPKPQLKKFVHFFEEKPAQLSYKGDSIVEPKSMLTSLLKEVSNIRGQHTEGQGRKPTKDESEFVLHTTILIWNLHNGKT